VLHDLLTSTSSLQMLSNKTSAQAAACTTKDTGSKMDAVDGTNYDRHEAIQAQVGDDRKRRPTESRKNRCV